MSAHRRHQLAAMLSLLAFASCCTNRPAPPDPPTGVEIVERVADDAFFFELEKEQVPELRQLLADLERAANRADIASAWNDSPLGDARPAFLNEQIYARLSQDEDWPEDTSQVPESTYVQGIRRGLQLAITRLEREE